MQSFTKHQLMTFLFHPGSNLVMVWKGKEYIFQGMTREDGSGRCFNVLALDIADNNRPCTLFIRTVD